MAPSAHKTGALLP